MEGKVCPKLAWLSSFSCFFQQSDIYIYLYIYIKGGGADALPIYSSLVVGLLKGYDQLMNLVLDEVKETLRGKVRLCYLLCYCYCYCLDFHQQLSHTYIIGWCADADADADGWCGFDR